MYLLPNQAVKIAQETTLSTKQVEKALKALCGDIDKLISIYRICKSNSRSFDLVIDSILKSQNMGNNF